jgi:hypothetical protein
MAIKKRPAVIHCRLGGDVGGTVAMGAGLEGDGTRPTCRAGAGEVPETHALEAAHEIATVYNLMVEGEAPEAATSELLKEIHLTCPQMDTSRGVLHCRLGSDVGGAVAMQWRE